MSYQQPDTATKAQHPLVGIYSKINPLINGPVSPGNHIQPNTAAPAAVTTFPTGRNVMNLVWPLTRYVQPLSSKDHP